NVEPVKQHVLFDDDQVAEDSAKMRNRVEQARLLQIERQQIPNSALNTSALRQHCCLTASQRELLEKVAQQFQLSNRGSHRILKLARTVADLNVHEKIQDDDLLYAVKLRCTDYR
ncbi:MAG: hypothetical protein ACR2QW_04080, partial [bacterium]